MVSTDKQNFTIVLDNQVRVVEKRPFIQAASLTARFPQNMTGFQPQVLAALVDGGLGSTTVLPPNGYNGEWPEGEHFRVNFVQNENSISSIYAQSGEFEIKASTSSSSTSGTKS